VPDRNHLTVWKILLTLSALLLWADYAMAYVGPGAGLELIPYFIGLLFMIGTAFLSILLYPIYALLRFIRGGKASSTVTEKESPEQPAAGQPAPMSGQQDS
jgi:hypothetical protein